jgi:mono/diheme cytochrome c family protein
VGEGTYLRRKIEQHQLDKIHGYGRIWRLSHETMPRDRTRPRMLNETAAQLVAHLSHSNGWWRDMAQQLLVLKQDTSVVPALQKLVRTSTYPAARFHALWTLEGLSALDAALLRELMKDRDPQMCIQAIRASETLYKAGDRSFLIEYREATKNPDTDVVLQAMLTLNLFKAPDLNTTIQSAQAANPARGIQHVAGLILRPASTLTGGRGRGALTVDQQTALERGETIYTELCSTCHGPDGRGTPTPGGAGPMLAPSLLGSPRVLSHRDYVIRTILHGMTGPVDGTAYGVMVPMAANTDEWIASVSSYIRNAFGNTGTFVTPADVARVRAATAGRGTPWTVDELAASVPIVLLPDAGWKATASHSAEKAAGGLSYEGWSSPAPQQSGMWYQVELPAVVNLTEIEFTSPTQGGGRGGPPPIGTYPRAYKVQVSMDGQRWSEPVAEGAGSGSTTTMTFAPARAKFMRITQTQSTEVAAPWTIQRLRLYKAAADSARSQ